MAKTVTCEQCGGVQAIFRDEEGKMNCAFCGEEIKNLPPYEEGESLDELDAADAGARPEGDPAEAVFTLQKQEVEDALVLTKRIKPHFVSSVVETVLLAFLLAVQVINLVGGLLKWEEYPEPGLMSYLLLIVIVALIPAVWILPRRTNKKIVERSVSGHELRVRVYENLCEVAIPAEEHSWNFEFGSEKCSVSECEDLFLITLSDNRLLAIPKRGFAEGTEALARERLVAAAGELTPFDPKIIRKTGKKDMAATEK